MIETGALIAGDPTRPWENYVAYWHRPVGVTAGNIPDTRTLWDMIWEHHQAKTLVGFAHTHPGNGIPTPSLMDVSTFVAIESALGRPIIWWIASVDRAIRTTRALIDSMPGREIYGSTALEPRDEPRWMNQLRARSNMFEQPYRSHGGGMGHDNN